MSAEKPSVNLLPEELLQEVFLRLPRKRLLRCRCLSKGLRNLIDCPIFKQRYDVFHNSISDFAVMIMEADRMFSMDFHLPDNLNSSLEKEVSIPHNKNPRFIGSCKGIVCLMVSPVCLMVSPALESYILLNPFNRTYQKVKCSNLYPFNSDFAIGFGYDYATDDYKIVRLEPVEHGTVRYLDVYSMRRDSWRQVVGEFSPGGSAHANAVCVDGVIHWLWLNNMTVYTCIAVFDLETEALRSLPLPPQLIEIRQLWSLHDFGGRLCVNVKCFSGSTIVWVMEEYGIESSWTRLFNIVNGITYVVGYFPMWDNVRLLCMGSSDLKTLLWLNTLDGSTEDIQILKLPRQQVNDGIWVETKSWVCVRSPIRLRCSESQND